jgi:hypothetical protein
MSVGLADGTAVFIHARLAGTGSLESRTKRSSSGMWRRRNAYGLAKAGGVRPSAQLGTWAQDVGCRGESRLLRPQREVVRA